MGSSRPKLGALCFWAGGFCLCFGHTALAKPHPAKGPWSGGQSLGAFCHHRLPGRLLKRIAICLGGVRGGVGKKGPPSPLTQTGEGETTLTETAREERVDAQCALPEPP